ncbi:MAG: ZIP family metal transporter [Pseudomonadota bacterium]
MTLSPTILLFVYSLAIAAFSVLGGLLPQWMRMTHTRTQLAMSLVSGLMLGVAFFHLLPHSVVMLGGPNPINTAVNSLMAGLVTMFLLLRWFQFHQHEGDPTGQSSTAERHTARAHRLSWAGIAFGLGVHTLIDGIALGAAIRGSEGEAGLAGVGVFLAILLHKPLDAMSIATIMQSSGWSKSARLATNAVFALMCPIGAALFYFGVDAVGGDRAIALALAFAAGAFICIALSDLLPEVQFHSHDRAKMSLVFLMGIGVALCMGLLEPTALHGGE